MEALASYVLRLVCGAMVCGILLSVTGTSGTTGRLRRLLCGLFVAFLVISPLRELDLTSFELEDLPVMAQGEALSQAGTDQARKAMEEIIKQQCTAYILTKAESLRLAPVVEVELDPETHRPVAVKLECQVTPYEKAVLTDYITQNLGIERSCVLWNR